MQSTIQFTKFITFSSASIALGATLALSTSAFASEPVTKQTNLNEDTTLQQVSTYGAEGRGDALDQVTSVSQFSDVRPTDWAFQALQSLVERYGCIVGYPDKTYRGNRALTRYEFAAGLNACLDKIQELIAAATSEFVRKEDLEVAKKLQEEFAAELAVLRGRVDVLEVRTATLEKQQFSTTTKLSGEVIFSVADTFGDAATRRGNGAVIPNVNEDDNTETVFQDRIRLSLRSSFSGKDLLFTRLEAKNATPFAGTFTGTNMTRLSYDGGSGPNGEANNAVRLDKLYYRFPIGSRLQIQVDAVNSEPYNGLVSTLSGPFASDAQGSISRFGRFNPLVLRAGNGIAPGSAGASFAYKLSDKLRLEGGYVSDTRSFDPSIKNGLLDGSYAALGQIVFSPTRGLDVGLSYVRSYYPGADVNLTSSTGSSYAAAPFANSATPSDTFAAQLQWVLNPKIVLGGWFGWTEAYRKTNSDEATVLNWAAFLGFPDLGRKGNLGGLLVGMPPKVVDTDFRSAANQPRRLDRDTSLHVEGFYRYRVTDNISITPGVIVIFNPEHQDDNDTQFVGVVRTTFSF